MTESAPIPGALPSLGDQPAPITQVDVDPAGATTPKRRVFWGFFLGLRNRTTAVFALGALAISIGLAVTTYQVARRNFVSQRRSDAQARAFANARTAMTLLSGIPVPRDLRDSLQSDDRNLWRIEFAVGEPVPSEITAASLTVPSDVSRLVKDERAASQLVRNGGRPVLVFGVPLVDGAIYYQYTFFDDIETPLRAMATSLAVAAALATIGAALLGNAASRTALRPLRQAARAARQISSGRLDTRLSHSGDTDLDSLVESFNEMAASLQARLEREARFASDVSHELRTPLTALSTAAQILKTRRNELSERAQTALDVMLTQTEHFERLVLDLLEISRFDAGAVELHADDIDFPDLVRQVTELAGKRVAVSSAGLRDPIVHLDKRRVERILANLLQNASLYAGDATQVILEDALSPPGTRRVRLIVEDHGPGVPEDERERIFERFTRGRPLAQRGVSGPKGTGLGLSLVAEHARLHGGRVWVEARDGGGARFVVEFDATDPAEES